MIGVEDWAEIRRLHRAAGRSIKSIARELELARNTVRAAIRSSEPPRYERQRSRSIVDAVEDEIRRWLAEWPTMPATVIAERIGSARQAHGVPPPVVLRRAAPTGRHKTDAHPTPERVFGRRELA